VAIQSQLDWSWQLGSEAYLASSRTSFGEADPIQSLFGAISALHYTYIFHWYQPTVAEERRRQCSATVG
jgi:hypothetical protein